MAKKTEQQKIREIREKRNAEKLERNHNISTRTTIEVNKKSSSYNYNTGTFE